MGLYSKFVLPHVINLAMRNKDVTRLRAESVPKARGEVLEIGMGSGLNLPFYSSKVRRVYGVDPSSIDTIVITWSLCSIPHPDAALQEMRRVLKPDGRMVFVEHGRAPDRRVMVWQDRLTPVWKRIGGGCHLNRKPDELIRSAGFQIIDQKNFYLPGPRPLTYTYQGIAAVP